MREGGKLSYHSFKKKTTLDVCKTEISKRLHELCLVGIKEISTLHTASLVEVGIGSAFPSFPPLKLSFFVVAPPSMVGFKPSAHTGCAGTVSLSHIPRLPVVVF